MYIYVHTCTEKVPQDVGCDSLDGTCARAAFVAKARYYACAPKDAGLLVASFHGNGRRTETYTMQTCMCMYLHTHVGMHLSRSLSIHTCAHMYMYIYICTYMSVYVHAYIYMYVYTVTILLTYFCTHTKGFADTFQPRSPRGILAMAS